jgi:hypothetical protein
MNNTIRVPAALSLLLICSFAAASPVAMVSDLDGAVTLSEAGKSRPAGLLAYLEPGTALRIAPGARVVLSFFSKPIEVTLTGPAEATLGPEGVTVAKGAAPAVRSLEPARVDAARKFELVQREKVGLAAVHMRSIVRPQLTVDGPANTGVYGTSPVLAWSGLPGVASYRLVLRESGGEAGGNTLVDQTVAGTSYALDQAPLRFGAAYEWRVEARLASGERVSAKASFSVIDGARAKRIAALKPLDNAAFSERVLFAVQLESEGLAYEAKREWRALAAERPEDAALRKWAER